MSPIRRPNPHRPGLRAAVISVSAVLIILAAVLVAGTVASHLQTTATNEAVRTASAVVHGYVDPLVATGDLATPTRDQALAIDNELAALVASKQILRIKIWSTDGTVIYSDLPALVGRSFGVDDDLGEALAGNVSAGYSDGNDAENVFEQGLASEFLSIYLPIEVDGRVAGAYEIYEDAAPIEAQIAAARQEVLLIVGAMALALFALLWIAFSGASRLLARKTRQLARSEERFRSLVQNSADVNMVLRPDMTIAYESPAVERVLGFSSHDHHLASAVDLFHPDDRAFAAQLLADVAGANGGQLSAELRARHADGSWRDIEVVLKNLLTDPAVTGIVVNYRDITERKTLEGELKRQAFHDSLTGLANRALFADRLEHAISRGRRFRGPVVALGQVRSLQGDAVAGRSQVALAVLTICQRRRIPARVRPALWAPCR